MNKTITLRLQENKYQRFKQLAVGDNRSISNFIENAALRFMEEEKYLDEFENDEILSNKELMGSIQRGAKSPWKGTASWLSYKIIESHEIKFLKE